MGFKEIIPDSFKENLTNALGWKTNRKLVVFESDDWGPIRMPSRKIYDSLKQKGLNVESYYNRFDSLETGEDLSALFEVLDSLRDKVGNPPVITANFLAANPAFERIKASNYQTYYHEIFPETYRRYSGCEKTFQLINEGSSAFLFRPQYHGREHLNVPLWMEALQAEHEETVLCFDYGFWGQRSSYKFAPRGHFLAALACRSVAEEEYVVKALVEGANLFENIFGFRSSTFIAPNYVWPCSIEPALSKNGVRGLQGQRNQVMPSVLSHCRKTKFHFTGMKNTAGQRYLVRNVFFEPSSDTSKDWVASCLRDVNNAFTWGTPAIISTHRVNFIGSLDPKNRSRNLCSFIQLLRGILQRWPDVEFMSSDQLIDELMQ